MFKFIASLAVGMLVLLEASTEGAKPSKAISLADAVKEFNERAQMTQTGREQPPLTEDEAIAAIYGWIRERVPINDDVYNAYQKIADTKELPEGANLDFTTNWQFKGHAFDVWWVDLTIKTGPKTGFTYRIRDRKLRCRPLGQ